MREKKVLNITLPWWLLCFYQIHTNISYSDFYFKNPTERGIFKMAQFWVVCLSDRKLSEIAKKHTTSFPNMLFTRSNEKLNIRWSITEHLIYALKCSQDSVSQLSNSYFIDQVYKFKLMTVKRSLFLIWSLSSEYVKFVTLSSKCSILIQLLYVVQVQLNFDLIWQSIDHIHRMTIQAWVIFSSLLVNNHYSKDYII